MLDKVGYTGPKSFQNCHKMAPSRAQIHVWQKRFKKNGDVFHRKGAMHPVVSEEKVHSPHKVNQAPAHEL
jgi:hypothetical protein